MAMRNCCEKSGVIDPLAVSNDLNGAINPLSNVGEDSLQSHSLGRVIKLLKLKGG